MRVLYVSKASHTPAHRDKLRHLADEVDLHVVVPESWDGRRLPPGRPDDPALVALPTVFSGRNHFHLYRGLADVARRLRPALIHMDEEPYSAVTWQGAGVARRVGAPFVFFAWQNIPKRYPPPFGFVRRSVFESAAGGIAGSDEAGDVLRRFGFRGPLAIIPQMGVDVERFHPTRERGEPGSDADPVVVGYLGRLVPEKGAGLLLEAVAGVPGVELRIGGSGPEAERLEVRARRADLAGRVRFDGEVPSLDVPDWLRCVDILALPSLTTRSWKEQFGRVVVEAMACGVPVVASRSGEIPRVVDRAGVLVPENDVKDLRTALQALAADPAHRRELGCLGRARAEARYSQAHIVRETVSFYERLLTAAPE